MQKPSLLADLMDIRAQLQRDQSVPRDQLKQRDRDIGVANNVRENSNPIKILRVWIRTLRSQQNQSHATEASYSPQVLSGNHVSRMTTTTTLLMWLTGMLFGAGLARTVLHYTGSEPVNLISALLVLLGLQLFSLLLLIIFWLGGMDRLSSSVSIFHPAKIVLGVLNKISTEHPFTENHRGAAIEKTIRTLIVYLGQHFTVALNLGILVTMVYLIATRDIAFGWSTSLQLDSQSMYNLLHGLSAPWNALIPSAAPTEQLVESSRFYRLQSQLQSEDARPDVLATWWTYLITAVTVYGLLPRIVALIVAGIKYDRVLSAQIMEIPGASQVLARIRSPLITTSEPHSSGNHVDRSITLSVSPRQTSTVLKCPVIGWAIDTTSLSFPKHRALEKSGISPISMLYAGGHNDFDQDQTTIEQASTDASSGIAIVVRSWEPPLAEFNDFLGDLRTAAGPRCPLIILLVALPEESVASEQLQIWETALAELRDSYLYIEAVA